MKPSFCADCTKPSADLVLRGVSMRPRLTGGSRFTWGFCGERDMPRLHLVLTDPLPTLNGLLLDWIGRNRIRVLNVAGPRESKEPGLQDAARRVLASILRGVALP